MFINIFDCEIEYKKYGTGDKPVLLLHGWGGNCDSLSCIGNMLENNHTIYAITFPTTLNQKPLDMNQYYLLVKQFIEQMHISKCDIICHSFGARVALMLCAKQPEYVNKLIIMAGAGIKPRFNIITFFKIQKYKILKKLNMLANKEYGSADYKALSKIEKQTFVNIVNQDLTKYSYYITCPTLLIYGNKDRQTPLYMAKKLQKNIKNSKLEIIKNCGHSVFKDNLPQCIKLIQEFLC